MSVMQIRGVAHPPPPRDGSRMDPSDLTAAEIATTNISGKPLLHEHDGGSRVGTCLASWEGQDGSLRIAAEVDHPETQQQIMSGNLRGLSLGTDMVTNPEGDVLFRGQAELSVCAEGRRDRTWIDTVNGSNVHRVAVASNNSASFPLAPDNPLHLLHISRETPLPTSMADSTAADATPTAASAEPTNEMMSTQAARIKELESRLAQETAKSSVFEDQARVKVGSFQPAAQWFYKEFLPEGESAEVQNEIASLGVWADEYISKKNVMDQIPLARTCEVASSKFKRLREEASVGAKASETLGKTMKELEELKAEDARKSHRITELEKGMAERQEAAEKLQHELSKHGLIAEKFDFSKLASREMTDAPAEPHATAEGGADPSLQAVSAVASRGAAADARARNLHRGGNPFDTDPLAAMILTRGQGGSRMTSSTTGHAFLGSNDANGDIASILRSGVSA